MLTSQQFHDLALSFPGVTEHPHSHRQAFKARIIFATLDEAAQSANIKLPEVEQSVFCQADAKNIYPVDNAWGKQGWTVFELKSVSKKLLEDALFVAYNHSIIKKKK